MAERLSWGLAKGGEWRELGWIKLRSVLGDPTKSYVGFFFPPEGGILVAPSPCGVFCETGRAFPGLYKAT